MAYRLATIHNLRFIIRLMEQIRESICRDAFPGFKDAFLSNYEPTDQEVRLVQKRKWIEAQRKKKTNGMDVILTDEG